MDSGSYRPQFDARRRRRQQARRRLLLLVVVVVIVIAVIAAVLLARGGSAGQGGTATGKATARPTPTTPPPKVWVASAAEPVRVWVGGDSMGGELGWAVGPMLEKTKVLKPILYYKTSSGICRWDFFDWGRKIDAVMRTVRPQAVVIMLGTNDTQDVWDNGTWIHYGNVAWREAYEQRVSDMMDSMFAGGARRVYWVGMPIMGEGWRNSRMKLIDAVFARQAQQHPGARYIDTWKLFASAAGTYLPQWRAGDGVHFTVAGQQRLATAVYKAVLADWLPGGVPSPNASASLGASASPGAGA